MKRENKRLLAWALALAMTGSLLPKGSAGAEEQEGSQGPEELYTISLGNAFYEEGSVGTDRVFFYPNATVTGDNAVYSLTISVSTGSIDTSGFSPGADTVLISDLDHSSETYVFTGEDGVDTGTVEELFRALRFKDAEGSDLTVFFDGNPNAGDFSGDNKKLTYSNGHYYLYVEEGTRWSSAYNNAKSYTLGGRKGYLATVTSTTECAYLKKIAPEGGWIGGTRLNAKSNTKIADDESVNPEVMTDDCGFTGTNNIATSTLVKYMYWACGPEHGQTWENLPQITSRSLDAYAGWTPVYCAKVGINTRESCAMTLVTGELNDYLEGNSNHHITPGYFVEFGGYAEGKDPGGREEGKCITLNLDLSPENIHNKETTGSSLEYATLADAITAAGEGEEIDIISASVTPVQDLGMGQGVSLKDYPTDGKATTWTADSPGASISMTADRKVTLKSGTMNVGGDSDTKELTVGGWTLTSPGGFTATAGTAGNTTTSTGGASVTVPAGSTLTVTKGGVSRTYTAGETDLILPLGEYTLTLDQEDPEGGVTLTAPSGEPVTAGNGNGPSYREEHYTVILTPAPAGDPASETEVEDTLTPGHIQVSMAGSWLRPGRDFTATGNENGTVTVTLLVPVTGELIYRTRPLPGSGSSGSSGGSSVSMPQYTITVRTGNGDGNETGNEAGTGNGSSSTPGNGATPTGGSVIPVEGSLSNEGKLTVGKGKNQTFRIVPDEGYTIADVLVDGISVGPVEEYTLEKVDGEHTIEALFVPLPETVGGDPALSGVNELLDTTSPDPYLVGYPGERFGPEDAMSRAQMAQMFCNLLLDQGETAGKLYGDVSQDAWYAQAVEKLAGLGLMTGIGGDAFSPEQAVTRGEFATVLSRLTHWTATAETSFTDVDPDAWYYDGVQICAQLGWLIGDDTGHFRPEETMTRSKVVVAMNRVLARAGTNEGTPQFLDVAPDHWAYGDIMAATRGQ